MKGEKGIHTAIVSTFILFQATLALAGQCGQEVDIDGFFEDKCQTGVPGVVVTVTENYKINGVSYSKNLSYTTQSNGYYYFTIQKYCDNGSLVVCNFDVTLPASATGMSCISSSSSCQLCYRFYSSGCIAPITPCDFGWLTCNWLVNMPTTIHVPADFGIIQDALNVACPGDDVLVSPGVYLVNKPIDFRGKAINLASLTGPSTTVIQMSASPGDPNRASVVIFDSDEGSGTVLDGFTISGGMGTRRGNAWLEVFGGGILCDGTSPTIRNCVLTGNNAELGRGGGIACLGSSAPALSSCTISGNTALIGGGVLVGGISSPTLDRCIIWGNSGGSIFIEDQGSLQATCSCIEGNGPWTGTGGNIASDPLFQGWPSPKVWVDVSSPGPGNGTPGSPFSSLASALSGFSLALSGNSPCLSLAGCGQVGADTGTSGGGSQPVLMVQVAAGAYELDGLSLAQRASLDGAGDENTILNGTIFGLRTGSTLSRVKITRGTRGGIAIGSSEEPEIFSCDLDGNCSESGPGGGIICFGSSPMVRDCRIRGNATAAVNLNGGAIACINSMAAFTRCWIMGNEASFGGGISCFESSSIFTNCFITGNCAKLNGGALFYIGDKVPELLNCTVSGNMGNQGFGGIFGLSLKLPDLKNCLFWDNGQSPECFNLTLNQAFSCSLSSNPLFKRSGLFDFNQHLTVQINGKEFDLPNFIVDMGDYHIQCSSPAVGQGDMAMAPPDDMDGEIRPCGSAPDLGADELCPEGCPFLRGDINLDGGIDISDAVANLFFLFLDETLGCRKSADCNDDGSLDLADPIFLLQYLFLGGASPPAPFPNCGTDSSPDALSCEPVTYCP